MRDYAAIADRVTRQRREQEERLQPLISESREAAKAWFQVYARILARHKGARFQLIF